LPLHPPRKDTCWMMLFSSTVTSIIFEQVPCVSYCTCLVSIISLFATKVRISEKKTKRILSFLEREYLRPQVRGAIK
jgi:hypothetical protein